MPQSSAAGEWDRFGCPETGAGREVVWPGGHLFKAGPVAVGRTSGIVTAVITICVPTATRRVVLGTQTAIMDVARGVIS